MQHYPYNRRNRRGLAIPEWCCILGFVALVLFAVGGSLGDFLQTDLDATADGLANPDELLSHPMFRDRSGDQDEGQSKPKGNNGVGNGEDPQPPGNPPINDGPGTGPGNPGNRGGAKKK